MKIKGFVQNGRLIHIGEEWPHDFRIELQPDPDDQDARIAITVDYNPMPDDVVPGEYDVVQTSKGCVFLTSEYAAIRHDEYPDIRDQLDALWKGGDAMDAMRAQVLAVKAAYPKV